MGGPSTPLTFESGNYYLAHKSVVAGSLWSNKGSRQPCRKLRKQWRPLNQPANPEASRHGPAIGLFPSTLLRCSSGLRGPNAHSLPGSTARNAQLRSRVSESEPNGQAAQPSNGLVNSFERHKCLSVLACGNRISKVRNPVCKVNRQNKTRDVVTCPLIRLHPPLFCRRLGAKAGPIYSAHAVGISIAGTLHAPRSSVRRRRWRSSFDVEEV